MATHSSILAWRIPGTGGAWWAAIYGVAQSWTWLKRLSSSSSSIHCIYLPHLYPFTCWWTFRLFHSPGYYTNGATMSTRVHASFWMKVFSGYICPGVGLQDTLILSEAPQLSLYSLAWSPTPRSGLWKLSTRKLGLWTERDIRVSGSWVPFSVDTLSATPVLWKDPRGGWLLPASHSLVFSLTLSGIL